MGRAVAVVITVVLLLLQSAVVLAAEGQVLKVVNGDTFNVEVEGARGTETVEVNLRCSDAPILNSPFGKESKRYLESLLHGSGSVNFKIQAYCGSETCVEVFAYVPDASQTTISYINTEMIAAGMARNDSCRGQFKEAEAAAKSAKKGIWSTTKRIVFADAVKVAAPTGAKKSVKSSASAAHKLTPPKAFIEVDRAERTVTLKSREMSLSKAIDAIDSVSTLPVSIYLFEEQYFPMSLDKVPWYKALQHIVQTANLKQVNMDGKIDLYDQFFYYKHIAPYLKLSDSGGVYVNLGNGIKNAPTADDGVTRYVFINDFENSAAAARLRDGGQHGYVQVHEGEGPAPVSNDGRFEITAEKQPPAVVAAVEPVIDRPMLTPYTGKPVAVKQQKSVATVDDEKKASKETASVPAIDGEGKGGETRPPAQSEAVAAGKKGVSVAADSEPTSEIDYVQIVMLLVVVVVVIFGSIFLSRSAGRRAAKAEKSVDPASLVQERVDAVADSEPMVDKAYEQEVFEDIVDEAATDDADAAVDEVFGEDAALPLEQESVAQAADDIASPPEEQVRGEETPEEIPEELPQETQTEPSLKVGTKVTADEGNFAVTLEDYDRMMNPPKREPRLDCLFEVTCRLEDQTLNGIGLDISSGGIFIDSKEKFAIGKVLELEFRLEEDDPAPIYCRGAVTWINERPDPIKPNYPNGFGVCFLELDDSIEVAISNFLHPSTADSTDDNEIDS